MDVGVGSLTQLEPVLDAVPTPLLLIEPGTARVLYINAAAHRLAGGRMEQAEDADYASVYGVFDPSGRRLASDEHPGVRAARGERFKNVPVDWVTAAGVTQSTATFWKRSPPAARTPGCSALDRRRPVTESKTP